MDKIPFVDGTKISNAKVTINEQEYEVTPAQYSGTTPVSAFNLNKMQDNIEDEFNKFQVVNNLETNLDCNYHANQLNYKKIGNIVFCFLVINTQNYTNNSEDDFELEMPFTFIDNWLFTNMKASFDKNYFLRCVPNSNKIKLVTDNFSQNYVKVKDVGTGYVIYAQFFAFVKEE